jgi:hypothetical protein
MAKKRKKKKTKISPLRLLAQSRVDFIKVKNKYSALWYAKDKLHKNQYKDIILWLHQNPWIKKKLFSPPFPKPANQLKIKNLSSSVSLEKEFVWGWMYLLNYADQISSFLLKAQEFEKAILLSDYNRGKSILDEIERNFGFSFWFIKNRLSLLQTSEGLEAQKLFANDIKQESKNAVVSVITHYISHRIETTVTPNKFIEEFQGIFLKLDFPKEFMSYLKYHILPEFFPDISDIHGILGFEASGSAIDYYFALLNMLALKLTKCSSFKEQRAFLPPIDFCKSIKDPRINIYLKLTQKEKYQERYASIASINAFEMGLKQNYDSAFDIAIETLNDQVNDYSSIETAARSLTMIDSPVSKSEDQLFWNIIVKMKSVIQKDNEFENAVVELSKISWDFITHPWAVCLLSFVKKECSDQPLEHGDGFVTYAALVDYSPHPSRIMHFRNHNLRSSYASLIDPDYLSNTIDQYQATCVEGVDFCKLEALASEERSLLIAENMYQDGRYRECLESSKELIESSQNLYRLRAVRLYANCLLELNLIGESISFIVGSYMNDRNLSNILPIKKAVEKIGPEEQKSFCHDIDLPILYDIFVRSGARKYDHIRAYSYEDFLISHNIDRPSGLEPILKHFDLSSLVYFLRYVCTGPVMDNSISFESSEEVAQERVNVCRLLLKLDSENTEIYQSEIKNILRRLKIKKKIREIEKSKIYINIESLWELAKKSHKESFNRYISFLQDGLDDIDLTLRKSAKETADKGDIEGLLALALPNNEINNLFEKMVVDCRDQFVSSTEHGLDGYLSVRIRHGTIYSHLRSPFELHKLITQKTHSSGKYKTNVHWLNKLNLAGTDQEKELQEYFDNFSTKVDSLVDKINNDWVQIKINGEERGLFDFTLVKSQIAYLTSLINENTTFEEFLDVVFSFFYKQLEISLKMVRENLQSIAKTEANDILTQLQTDIDKHSLFYDTGDLSAAISKGRTEIQFAIDRVTEWFRFFQSKEKEPFFIEDAISIAEESVRISCTEFNLNLFISDEMKNLKILGNLPSFVDMLFIIFENIVKHSNLEKNPEADVSVFYNENIIIKVVNKVGEEVVNQESKKKIDEIKIAISERKYGEAIRKEGGTGFQKLQKLLSYDFKLKGVESNPNLDFGFIEEDKFYVEVGIPFKELKKGYNQSENANY